MESINLNINVKTKPKCLNDISQNISNYINNSEITNGLCTLFIKHTSASLVIQENADPAVLRDIESFFTKIYIIILRMKSYMNITLRQGIYLYEH